MWECSRQETEENTESLCPVFYMASPCHSTESVAAGNMKGKCCKVSLELALIEKDKLKDKLIITKQLFYYFRLILVLLNAECSTSHDQALL